MKRAASLVVVLAAALAAEAGDFSVAPVRMELGGAARTGTFTIRNDGKEPLSFQVQGMAWTQDAEGRDRFTDAADLVYFPRLVTVDPGQDAVVRVGVRQPLVDTEKTYRLFVEELPNPDAQPGGGSQVRVLVRFGPPIFVRPAKPQARLEVDDLRYESAAVHFALRNSGNEHQLVEAIRLHGQGEGGRPVFTALLSDRYLLAGTVKRYASPLTREQCLGLRRLVVEVKTDKASLQRDLEARATPCP
jgi:fimbrial chaperone protein